MSISCDQINNYANQFLPQFQFADTEQVFPIAVDAWLQHCSIGDWSDPTDPHRGTVAVTASLPLTVGGLAAGQGCHGSAGTPIDPTQPLTATPFARDEFFLDFAGWPGLQSTPSDFSSGDDDYIKSYLSPYFSLFNSALAGSPPPVRHKMPLPTTLTVYCEAAWAGDFTRLDITNMTGDFAPTPVSAPGATPIPDPNLDPFFVLTYYLFYPCTEPPPITSAVTISSPSHLRREGQWEAVSLYFRSTGGAVQQASDLQLAADPSQVTPDFAVLSIGIVSSGDGQDSGLATGYPGAATQTWPKGGQIVAGSAPGGKVIEPVRVYVTSGTHKNLTSPTPTATTTTSDPGWLATGGATEAAGGAVVGLGASPFSWPLVIVGALMILAGFLMQLFGKDSSTTELPNSAGDIASGSGPGAGAVPGAAAGPGFVGTKLVVMSTLPNNPNCQPPPWWNYPGRWGVAVSSAMSSWDSGGRRFDFRGRSRAYFNTVILQGVVG
jgi:hypothetical protein